MGLHVKGLKVQQAAEKSKECFDELSMNGNFSTNSNLFPFVLSVSKDSERFCCNLSKPGQLIDTLNLEP
jgi:hypothetical protein